MDAQHKAAKIISGLVLLASILLLIDYYLPAKQKVLVVESKRTKVEKERSRYGKISRQYFTYIYADGVKISQTNFRRISFMPGDSILLTHTPIYNLQLEIKGLSGYIRNSKCHAEFDPFVLNGLFILISILLALGALRSKEKAGTIVGTAVAIVILFALLCPLFIL